MKGIILIALCVACFAVVLADDNQYTSEFDSLDVKEIFGNNRIYTNYKQCILTGEKCTPAGKKLVELLPDALKTECAKCTASQKEKGDEVIRWIVKNEPDDFLAIEKKFDEERKYRLKFADKLKSEGIILPEPK